MAGMLTKIGKYTIESEIGQGGFGQVYRAFDPSVGRVVAIKVLKPGADQSVLTRFRNEAVAAGNLQHRHIVTVYEFGEQDGLAYLVMEFLQGRDLQHVMQEGPPLSLLQKVHVMSQTASGLHCAHLHGVVHRDVKPANIMLLPDDTIKIMDFGIARLLHANQATQTQAGFIVGSLLYLSPEQYRSGPIDALCDIWAYGVIYYELLTGRHPFPASDAPSAMYQIQNVEPQPLLELAPDCPPSLADIIGRALAKNRDLRYQSLEDLRLDTEPILLQLQKQESETLAIKAQQLAERNEWDTVQRVVKQVLELDPSNQTARQLREAMQQRTRRRSTRPKVDALVKQGVEQLSNREYPAAIDAFEAALRLDQSDSAVRSRLAEALSKLEQSKKAAELVKNARLDLESRNLTNAFEQASEALRLDPDNADALATLSAVKAEASRREAELAMSQGIERARGLLLLQSFDEALAILAGLKSKYPPNAAVEQVVAELQRQKTEHERHRRLASHLDAGKDLLKRGSVQEAASRLEAALIDFPEHPELRQLFSYAQQQLEARRRVEALDRIRADARRLIDAQNYDAALQAIEIAIKANPGDSGLIGLLQSAVTGKAAQSKEAAIQAAIRKAEVLARQHRVPEALDIITQAAGQYSDDPRLPALRDRLSEHMRQTERTAAIGKAIADSEDFLKRGESERAIALLQSHLAKFPEAKELRQACDAAILEKARQDEQRAVMAALERAGRLEHEDQFAAAFGIITAALRIYPGSEPLQAAESRLRQHIAEEERRYVAARERDEIEELISARRYSDALDRVDRARKADAANDSLDQLHQRVNSLVAEESDRYASRIRTALQSGELAQAEELLLDGLRVLPGAGVLIQLKREVEQHRDYRQVLLTARAQLESGDFKNAEAAARQALKIKPDDATAKELLRDIGNRRAEHERNERIDRVRKNAGDLIARERFSEARKALLAAIKNFPDSPDLRADLAEADAAQRSLAEREQREAQIAGLLKLQRAGNAPAVLAGASQLLPSAPGESRVRELISWAEQTIAEAGRGRERSISEALSNSRSLLGAGRFADARKALTAAIKRFPDAQQLRQQMEALDAAELRHKEQQQRDAQIATLVDLKNGGNAERVLSGATQLLSAHPDEGRAAELERWARASIANQEAHLREKQLAREKAERERLEREKEEQRQQQLEEERIRRDREQAERERLQSTEKAGAAAAGYGASRRLESYSPPQPATTAFQSSPHVAQQPPAQDSRKRSLTWAAIAASAVLAIAGGVWIVRSNRPPLPPLAPPLQVDVDAIAETTLAATQIHKTLHVGSAAARPFAASPTAAWIHISSSSSTTPAVLDVNLDASKLNAGDYAAAIEIRGANGGLERSIPVHLTIPAPPPPTTGTTGEIKQRPVLAASPLELRFECEAGSSFRDTRNVVVSSNPAATTFQARVQTGAEWLSVTPRSGKTPSNVSVAVNAKSLSEGNHSGSLVLQLNGSKEGSTFIRVSMVVHPAQKTVQVTPPVQQPPPPQVQIAPPPVQPTTPPPAVTPQRPYTGASKGHFFWPGTLGPKQEVTFTAEGVPGGEDIQRGKLPNGVDVKITRISPELVQKEVPAASNHNKLVLLNTGSSPVTGIEVWWALK